MAAGVADAAPLPDRLTVCEPPAALSVTVKVPLRVPARVGVKVTLASQLASGARLAPQLLVWAKSPVAAILATVRAALPTLTRARICGPLALATV